MTPEERLHYELRDLWALVTEHPRISLQEIANELDVTLRATVPMITMKRKKSNDEEIPTTPPLRP